MIAKDKRDLLRANEPIAVPLDKAPLRPQGDLLATLALLQESYALVWVRETVQISGSALDTAKSVGDLIATAVQQAEALPKPEGDLAAWQEKAQIILADVLDLLSGPMPAVGSREAFARSHACKLKAHLAAMPAPPDVKPESVAVRHHREVRVRKAIGEFFDSDGGLAAMDTAVRTIRREWLAEAEEVPEQAASRRPCVKCGGRPAEHRYLMGKGEWCECMEDCTCDGYVAEEGAE